MRNAILLASLLLLISSPIVHAMQKAQALKLQQCIQAEVLDSQTSGYEADESEVEEYCINQVEGV